MDKDPPAGRKTHGLLKTAGRSALLHFFRLRHTLTHRPAEFIFINGVARSGTTLLSNILCSHREISGYGETKLVYRSADTLADLVSHVHLGNRQWRCRERYVLEKIVQDQLIPDRSVLDAASIRWIYQLRDPTMLLRSYLEYFPRNEQQALDYYLARLQRLQQDARHHALCGQHSFFLTYEELVGSPQQTLIALSDFLGLESCLQRHYTQPRMHHPGTGDQSERIRSGDIIRQTRSYRVEISPAALAQARHAHVQCSETLRQLCVVVPGVTPAPEMAADPVMAASVPFP